MQTESGISSIANAIQLSIAPVFLLTGVGAILGVLTNRLARIVDRSRVLDDRLQANPEGMDPSAVRSPPARPSAPGW